jgi:hypothetical protein
MSSASIFNRFPQGLLVEDSFLYLMKSPSAFLPQTSMTNQESPEETHRRPENAPFLPLSRNFPDPLRKAPQNNPKMGSIGYFEEGEGWSLVVNRITHGVYKKGQKPCPPAEGLVAIPFHR